MKRNICCTIFICCCRHRPKSALARGQSRVSSRPGTANAPGIEETDENAPDPAEIIKIEQTPPAVKLDQASDIDTKQEVSEEEDNTRDFIANLIIGPQ